MENENINPSVEMEEVAELSTDDVESSEEKSEVAEPTGVETEEATEEVNGRTEADRAFAEQRRRIAELERQNAEVEASSRQMQEALSRFFDGDTPEELSNNAGEYARQANPEAYEAFEANRELENLRAENESLKGQMLNAEVERLMHDGLLEIQAIDPSIKSLDELGDSFAKFISAGLSTTEAYYASKIKDSKEKVYPPEAVGKVADTKTERDYYTSEELDNLTDEEIDNNWEKVQRSMQRL